MLWILSGTSDTLGGMSWENDDGTHEGYVLPEFIDGVRGRGIWSGSVPVDHVIVDVEYVGEPGAITAERYTSRPAAEVIGWRVMCDCRASGRSSTMTWTSDLIVRVPSKSLEDQAAARIFVPDDDVIDVEDTYHEMLTGIWRHEHVDGESALTAITRGRRAVNAAERDLDAAVEVARSVGESWEAIGRAAGITRQSAHSRWAPSDADVAAAKRQLADAVGDLAVAPLDQKLAGEIRRRLQAPALEDAKAVLQRNRRDRQSGAADRPPRLI